jgi:hypothetical protein
MANRLDPINLVDFSGGINTRASPFQLAENETTESFNVAVDTLGGIYSRRGWERWNTNDLWDPDVEGEEWNPRRAYMHSLSDGTFVTYVAANEKLFGSDGSNALADLGLACAANTHLADFASLGNDIYIARGRHLSCYTRHGSDTPVELTPSTAGNWNDDYTTPIGGYMPQAELVEAHAGYVFVANITEDGVEFPNRIRWSHPTSPGDWAQLDYIDILAEGDRITGLMSFQDHLLVFKSDGLWAIYGYDAESWQVIKKSTTSGAPGPQAVTRSETAVFYYSGSDLGALFVYQGEVPQEISSGLRRSLGEINRPELVWVGWLGRKLWVTVPWDYTGPQEDSTGVFVFDPAVGETGCWMFYASRAGGLGPLVGGSNIDSSAHPMGVMRNSEFPRIVLLDSIEDRAWDLVSDFAVLGASGADPWNLPALVTDTGDMIIASGMPGVQPYETIYRTPWLTAGWPTRKKSFRRPDFVCRRTGLTHQLRIQSFRDYEEINPRRQHTMQIDSQGISLWGEFDWGEGQLWGSGRTTGNKIVRGGSFGLCKALQVRIAGLTPGARWGIDAIIMKLVMRRFH